MMFVVQQYFFIILSIWSLKLVKNSSPRIKHKHIHTCKLSLVCAFSIEVRDSRAAKDWGHEQATLPPFISNQANTHHHTPHPQYIYIYNHHQSSLLHSYALSPFLLCQHSPRVYFFFCNCSFCNSLQHPFAMSSSQSKKLINNPNDVATEYIEGMVETYPNLQYLDGFPEVKVLLRADVSRGTYSKVAIISGGGSGHEPATGGFVGEGMLTAAVCGDVFASPPMNSILAAIRAVTGPPGCLLIVTNYTGDRLNFGLAAEQAKSEGYKVEMVIVGDDCALPPTGIIGRRGLAGTILVQKVAGAAAEAGLPLASVAAEAVEAASVIGTMGVALSVCTIPGQVTSDRLGPGKMELGLGIHGEPGVAVVDLKPVDEIVSLILKQIISSETGCVTIKPGCKVALMVNGLGATPLMELMVATGKAVAQLQLDHGLAVERVYTGSFMTSLDMAGFSLTVMKVEACLLQRLDHPTKAPYWVVGVSGPRPPTKLPIPVPSPPTKTKKAHCRPQELNIEGQIMEMAIKAAAEALINIKESLNEWDSKVGDGDCGSTISRGAHAILEDMEKYYPLNDPAATIGEIGASIGRVMGGTSGVIYDIFFKAAYAKLKENSAKITAKEWANALEAAVEAVSKYGGATAGCRTLLDALIPASKALQERLSAGDSPLTAFMISSEAALEGAESTKKMRPQAGRSAYIPTENLGTVPDPGAAAVAAWYKAAAKAVTEFSQKET